MRSALCAPQCGPKKTINKKRRICMKKRSLISILLALFVGFISVNAKASITIATFADPSGNSGNPLFTVDFLGGTLSGGWGDDKTGLTLEIPYNGHTFRNAWFEMGVVQMTSVYPMFGQTGAGVINFYADGALIDPLLIVNFESGTVSRYGLGANEIFVADNVTITGSEIVGTLSEEQFSFSFANLAKLPSSTNWNDGFTATAAFTSSAIVTVVPPIPEPATIALSALAF